MTGSEGHRARMDSDTPRGYGVRGDVRKRLEGQHQAHPDPAVRKLLAGVRAETLEECAQQARDEAGHRLLRHNIPNALYDAACNRLASVFDAAASEIRSAT